LAKDREHKPAAVQVTGALAEKLKAAELALSAVEKKYGKGSILKLGKQVGVKIPCIPTGIFGFDEFVVQAGGFPRGRITEIFGPESSGKTTLALTAIAQAQKQGGLAAFVDAEHALDPTYASKLGVDVNNLVVSQPDSGEEALEVVETLIRSGAFDIVVVDSVAALVPQAELDGEMGNSNMGLQARLMSQAMRKLRGITNTTSTCLVFLNQIREKIGVMFGSPETTTGGRALKFYTSLRIDIRRIKTEKEGDLAVANRVKIKAVKNKVGNPFRETEVDLEFGKGFNAVGSYLDAGVERGVVDKSGAWFSYKGERIGQGRDAAIETFTENTDLYAKLQGEVKAASQTVEG
jgi:recombination protein RecA